MDAESTGGRRRVSFEPPQATVIEPLHLTIPLSSLPAAALANSASSAADADAADSSSASTASCTTATTKTGGRLSSKAADVGLRIGRPRQVTGRATKYHNALAWTGRAGWCGKAVVYGLIGGLACQSAVSGDRPSASVAETEEVSASPQGAFVLLGATAANGVSIVLLLVMLAALAAYITWRFWEGLAGQGYDETFSAKKNFFKFRVSPIVSGCVYVSYLVFIISLIDKEVRQIQAPAGAAAKEGWPATWRHTPAGRVGLALLGIAFVIATCIQLQGVLTRQWHRDYRSDLPRPLMLAVFTIGHFGFAGRAGAFLSMAILFFKDAGGVEDTPHNASMVANALDQLHSSRGLRAILMIVGLLLVVYGLFAVLSAFTRMFPTPPPSRRKRVPAAEHREHQHRHKHQDHRHHDGSNVHDQQQQQQEEQQPEDSKRCCVVLPWRRHANSAHANSHRVSSSSTTRPGSSGNSKPNRPSSAAVAMTSTASSSSSSTAPVMLDTSPGWGTDQGLSKSSLQQELQDDAAVVVSASQPPAGPLVDGPTAAVADQLLDGMFVAPLAVSPASAAGHDNNASSARVTPGVHRLAPQRREFVTIDL